LALELRRPAPFAMNVCANVDPTRFEHEPSLGRGSGRRSRRLPHASGPRHRGLYPLIGSSRPAVADVRG
jgi:hypothetical protein